MQDDLHILKHVHCGLTSFLQRFSGGLSEHEESPRQRVGLWLETLLLTSVLEVSISVFYVKSYIN